ncbi:unnamed protein product, partial [marine sediment metagenome]
MTAEWTLGPEPGELEGVGVDWSRGVEGIVLEGGLVFKSHLIRLVVNPLRIVNVA